MFSRRGFFIAKAHDHQARHARWRSAAPGPGSSIGYVGLIEGLGAAEFFETPLDVGALGCVLGELERSAVGDRGLSVAVGAAQKLGTG